MRRNQKRQVVSGRLLSLVKKTHNKSVDREVSRVMIDTKHSKGDQILDSKVETNENK
jgi:hypothetical protein